MQPLPRRPVEAFPGHAAGFPVEPRERQYCGVDPVFVDVHSPVSPLPAIAGLAALELLRQHPALLEDPAFRPFKAHGRQRAVSPGAGIQTNPVGQLHNILINRMAMNDDLVARRRRAKKFPADQKQIGKALLLKRNVWTNAGMNEDIVSCDDQVLEGLKKAAMALRNNRLKHSGQFLEIGALVCLGCDAIADDCFPAAYPDEVAQRFDIAFERGKECRLVIAEQKSRAGTRFAQPQESIDNLRRMGPPIDQIAQEDQFARCIWAVLVVMVNPSQQAFEQFELAMNIANGIYSVSCRKSGCRLGLFAKKQFVDQGLVPWEMQVP